MISAPLHCHLVKYPRPLASTLARTEVQNKISQRQEKKTYGDIALKEKKTDENIALNRTCPSTTNSDSRIESRALLESTPMAGRRKSKQQRRALSVVNVEKQQFCNIQRETLSIFGAHFPGEPAKTSIITIIVHLRMQPEDYGAAIYIFLSSRPVSHLHLPGFFSCGVARSSSFVAWFLSSQHPLVGLFSCPLAIVQNYAVKYRKENQRTNEKTKERQPLPGSSYLPTRFPSGSSLSLPNPHSPFPSLSSARCSSHPRVATTVWMKSCNIVAPFGAKRRECSAVSLVIPACRLSSWHSLQPRSRCLTLWTLSEHWHCMESYDGRHIRKDLKYSCSSRSW